MKPKCDHKKRNVTIAKLSLEAQSLKDIGKQVGLSKMQVSRIRKKPEIKKLMDEAIEYEIGLLPRACERHGELLEAEDGKVVLEAIKLVHKNTGITPAHTSHPVIEKVYNIQQAIILSPVVHELMDKHLDHVIDGEIIEDNEE